MSAGAGWQLFRDPHGVPHVQAEDLTALAHGHGYVTGVDRAWYAEVLRRRAEARSAELVGPDALDADQLSLAVDVVGTARRWWEASSPEDRAFFAAYARGMSEALAEVWVETPQARAAGVADTPVRPWDPWTPVAVHLDAHLLTGSLPEQLWRRRVRATLGEAWVPVLDAESPAAAGSNAWLVPGHLSASGAPLLAADPHRIVEESGPYQPVCLSAPGLRVRGLALVGLPGVPHFGRTESAAWAITAAMTVTETVTDVALEHRAGAWRVADTGEPLERHRTVLRARDGVERPCSVWRCAAGFVLPGTGAEQNALDDAAAGDRATVTVVTPAPVPDTARALAACRETLLARTADDVVDAFTGWAVPCNDLLAADDEGACCHAVVGAFLGEHEPRRELREVTVRANQRPSSPGGSAVRLACASPHRAQRATALLRHAVDRHGTVILEDLAAAQLDTAAPHWPGLLRFLFAEPAPGSASAAPETGGGAAHPAGGPAPTTASGPAPAADPILDAGPGAASSSGVASTPARRPGAGTTSDDGRPPRLSHAASWVRARLLSWDGSMAAESTGASWFAVWRDAFVRELVAGTELRALTGPTGRPAVWDPFLYGPGRVGLAVENVLRRGPALGVDVTTCALVALERVAEEHLAAGGQVLPAWGTLHAFTPWRGEPAATAVDPVPVGGDTDCLLATGTVPGTGPACLRVPAARVLWDLADPAASWWITPDPVDRRASASVGDGRESPGVADVGAQTPEAPAASAPAPILPGRADGHPRSGAPDVGSSFAGHPLSGTPEAGSTSAETPARGGSPLARWARGELDHALPWVPAGAVGPTGAVLDLGPLEPTGDGETEAPRAALRPVNPARDAALLHEWVSAPRARFWGMNGLSVREVQEIYTYLEASPTHHAWLIELDGEPVGLFQSYEPHADPVGALYRVEPGDLGIHVLLAPVRRRRPGLTAALGRAALGQIARHGSTRRIVAEPDVSNERALSRAVAMGFELGPAVELPGKTGRLAFLRVPATPPEGRG
ncbi:GNAT family N-acetyltransferase [Kocuria tytonicola]|uniref:GNAT family N-acetyltransferase n=1 Tax=Kocuria tytonicola TaxID=2055946 RepID=UPI001FB1B601|nr:GNAT family N-acetyltransferase [Kocuria tytonicola]